MLAETEEEELGVPPTRPCQSWQKSFELIMTIAEREKATPKYPTGKGHQGYAAVQGLRSARSRWARGSF